VRFRRLIILTNFDAVSCHSKPVYAYVLQIIVVANHMSGKDTHVRGLRVLGPIEDNAADGDPFSFVTTNFKMYEGIR